MNILNIKRNEIKYLLHPLDAVSLKNELDLLLQRDIHSAAGSYMVRSLYFDSMNEIDYKEKFAGNEKRKKIRIRIYDTHAQTGKFEIKQKHGNYSRKRSLTVSREEINQAAAGNYSFLLNDASDTALELYSLLSLGCYRPKAVIEYQRTAFLYPENNIRVTLDTSIKSSETNLDLFGNDINWTSVIDENVILEIKYDGKLLKVISDILKKYKLTQISVSKYTTGRTTFSDYLL